jgi:uncharacterized protein YdeI (BOF family)
MIKRIITLLVTSSVISAGLLYLGFTVLGQYSPAHASSLNALVARSTVQNSPNVIPAGKSSPVTVDLRGGVEKSEVSSPSIAVSAIPVSSDQPLPVSVNSVSTEAPVAGVTIAQLLNSPDQFIHQIISITGIATSLVKDKFLLNDGTGQLLVEVEDDLVGFTIIDGMSITVMGKLDDSSSQSGIVLEAHTLTDKNGTVVSDDCIEDDSSIGDDDCLDDSDDDCLDDSDDDCLDDSDDDCLDDSHDDSNDGSQDDSNDGSQDDSSDGSQDDSSDGSQDDSSDGSQDDSNDGSHDDSNDGSGDDD